MKKNLPIDSEIQQFEVTFGNAALPDIAARLATVGYTPARQQADYAQLQELRRLRFQQLQLFGQRDERLQQVQTLERQVRADLTAFRNLLRGAEHFYPQAEFLIRVGLERTLGSCSRSRLVSVAGSAYQSVLRDPELLARVQEFQPAAQPVTELLAKVERLIQQQRELDELKSQAQVASRRFYAQRDALRRARQALKNLACVAFADALQRLESLAFGPIR